MNRVDFSLLLAVALLPIVVWLPLLYWLSGFSFARSHALGYLGLLMTFSTLLAVYCVVKLYRSHNLNKDIKNAR